MGDFNLNLLKRKPLPLNPTSVTFSCNSATLSYNILTNIMCLATQPAVVVRSLQKLIKGPFPIFAILSLNPFINEDKRIFFSQYQ